MSKINNKSTTEGTTVTAKKAEEVAKKVVGKLPKKGASKAEKFLAIVSILVIVIPFLFAMAKKLKGLQSKNRINPTPEDLMRGGHSSYYTKEGYMMAVFHDGKHISPRDVEKLATAELDRREQQSAKDKADAEKAKVAAQVKAALEEIERSKKAQQKNGADDNEAPLSEYSVRRDSTVTVKPYKG